MNRLCLDLRILEYIVFFAESLETHVNLVITFTYICCRVYIVLNIINKMQILLWSANEFAFLNRSIYITK